MRLSAIIMTSMTLGLSQYASADSVSERVQLQANQIEQLQRQVFALQHGQPVAVNGRRSHYGE